MRLDLRGATSAQKWALWTLLGLGSATWVGGLGFLALRAAYHLHARPVPTLLAAAAEGVGASILYWPLLLTTFIPLGWLAWVALTPREEAPGAGGVSADIAGEEEFLGPGLRKFLGASVETLAFRSCGFDASHVPNLDAALEDFGKEPGTTARSVGWIPEGGIQMGNTLVSLVGTRRKGVLDDEGLRVGPIEERAFPTGAERERACLVRGVRLFTRGDVKLVVQVSQKETYFSESAPLLLEVTSPSREATQELLDYVKRHLERHNVYRGAIVSLDVDRIGRPRGEGDQLGIQFHAYPTVAAEELILPAATRELLVRNTLGFVERRPALRRVGQDLRRGLLFHGPPGTGKTYAVRYLSRALPGHTTLLATGENLGQVAAYFRLARILAPSLLVFEDIDLIAEERSLSPGVTHTLLNSLLNEMDGLKGDAEVVTVLTTNRPEVLEPALAARPGRVDQAVEFPLPDAECRRRLFALYGRGLQLRLEKEDDFVQRTDGASPAFLKELFRRAALAAVGLEGGDGAGGDGVDGHGDGVDGADKPAGAARGELRVGDLELDAALRELTLSGGPLTQALLGFRSGARGGRQDE
ncbi:MAG: 26S protease regulatory subunit [Planctomycetes bacterium]|nr:26S protease regulatory subunit [Planctomycetota bacterium]